MSFLAVPSLEYLKNQNIFSGSYQNYNFKIFPKGEVMTVAVWFGRFCYDKSEITNTEEFTINLEGYQQMIAWIEQHYQTEIK